jgi:hypothetical protein
MRTVAVSVRGAVRVARMVRGRRQVRSRGGASTRRGERWWTWRNTVLRSFCTVLLVGHEDGMRLLCWLSAGAGSRRTRSHQRRSRASAHENYDLHNNSVIKLWSMSSVPRQFITIFVFISIKFNVSISDCTLSFATSDRLKYA